jgi:hypothetical protein
MKPKYKEISNTFGDKVIIQENSDGTIWSFMENEDSPLYKAYLRWLENPDAEAEHLNGSGL